MLHLFNLFLYFTVYQKKRCMESCLYETFKDVKIRGYVITTTEGHRCMPCLSMGIDHLYI